MKKEEKRSWKNSTERQGNSKHKDTLFRLIFQDKKDLMELYNAIRGTAYDDPDDLEVTTIQNMFYMKMKNDLSFLIDHVMNLYEHQSTVNPNMCLRGVDYFSRLYKKYLKEIGANVYGSKRIPLPYPQYIIFYNGIEEQPERQVVRLSDSYIIPENMQPCEEPGLECRAVILNINLGRNRELMEKSQKLLEYAQFVECVRKKAGGRRVTEEVMDDAIEECIGKNILKEILEDHREEVCTLFGDKAWERHLKLEEKRWKEEEKRLEEEEKRLEVEKERQEENAKRLEEEKERQEENAKRLEVEKERQEENAKRLEEEKKRLSAEKEEMEVIKKQLRDQAEELKSMKEKLLEELKNAERT